MDFKYVKLRVTDPAELIPHLFESSRPNLVDKLKTGDFIVAGENLGCGKAHTPGYIAIEALGLRVLCASMPAAVIRATATLGLPVMCQCADITHFIRDGDEIEADFETGEVLNLTTGEQRTYPAPQSGLRALVAAGGLKGMLKRHLAEHPELATPL
jgi:3-isopropylmalate/(R)-2-methylmalate dehydratase small subunit